MSLTAATLMPLFHSLSEEEKRVFAAQVSNMAGDQATKARKKKKNEKLPEIFRPENREALIWEIMHAS